MVAVNHAITELEQNLFLGKKESLWLPASNIGVFGGQIVAQVHPSRTCVSPRHVPHLQALFAAQAGLPKEFVAHSLHTYFILPAKARGWHPALCTDQW